MDSYRYGFQNQEKDDEIKGGGNSYTTFYRQLDPRVGRWFSLDPKMSAWESPYVSMGNNPILYFDHLGDTVRRTPSFKKDRHLMKSYEKWSKSPTGKQFLKEYGIGGKYEHISVVFDNTLPENDVWATARTGTYSVNKKTKKETPLDGAKVAPSSALAKGNDKDNFLRFIINFHKSTPPITKETELDYVIEGAVIVHETDHVKIGHNAVLENKIIPSTSEQHSLMGNPNKPYWWGRVDYWWYYTPIWYNNYLEEKRTNKEIKNGYDYIIKQEE